MRVDDASGLASRLAEVADDDIDAVLTNAVSQVRDRAATMDRASDDDLAAAVSRMVGTGEPDVVVAAAIAVAAARRYLGVTLHGGQIAAGLALACGWTVQMRTGEGKTFAAIAPALFHATAGRPVHVVTANSYLARRDANWSGSVLRAVGVSTGWLLPGSDRARSRQAYAANVTYGAGADFGFDYLRDALWLPGDEPVQRGLGVAIVDEADAVLVDHARTPLVLSAPARLHSEVVHRADDICRALVVGDDVVLDETHHRVDLTPEGVARCEALLGVDNLYSPGGVDWPHLVQNALRARSLLRRGRDYIVARGAVHVIDELTGRIAPGRRWSDGLHQAVEAKEGLLLTADRRPVGRVTVGGYFGEYELVVGMSGTLEGVDEELHDVYGTRTLEIPTEKPVIRIDHDDASFDDHASAVEAVVDDVAARHRAGQPVLVGTTSIEHTMEVATALAERHIPHVTLTAENDEEEAEIVAGAGRRGRVTVATQMAGRGVDIVLGGAGATDAEHHEVCGLGGLMVWGFGHHPAHRLDMQLRGRAGRQGDPGETRFASAIDDDIVRLAPPNTATEDAAAAAQRVAEDLDRELRDDVRELEGLVDRLQAHLHRWREAAATADLSGELTKAVAQAVAAAEERGVTFAGVTREGLPRFGGKRRRELHARFKSALAARRSEFGEAMYDDATRLLLRNLLVVLWGDQLDELEQGKQLTRVAPAFATRVPAWTERAVRSYAAFEASVRSEWVRQLLAFSVVTASASGDAAGGVMNGDADGDVLPDTPGRPSRHRTGASAGDGNANDEDSEAPLHLAEWNGWSFNRFVRQHFGVRLPDPPLVLAIDAIGDSFGGMRLELDLDDPSRTRVVVAARDVSRA